LASAQCNQNYRASIFFFDEADDFPCKLIKEGFACRDVDHCELNAAHVCAGHGNLLHAIHVTDSFDHQRKFTPVLFDNLPVNLVLLFIHLGGSFHNELPVSLWSVQKRVDVRQLVQQTSLKIQTLEACVQMPLGEFGGGNNERHQPVQGVLLVPFIIVFGFGLKYSDEQIAPLGSLDGSGSGKEVSKTLQKCCNLNVFNNTVISINIACRVKKL
jgi:hypothetical protein